MKLATFRNGTRDGALMVVSRDLTKAVRAEVAVAGLRTLQQLLDDWQSTQLKVERIYAELNEAVDGRRPAPFEILDFDASRCTAPLPRAYQWADGSAYVNHVQLLRRARGADMPASFWTEPLMYQGGSDAFLGPREFIELADEAWGIDLEGELAVITDDVPMGEDGGGRGQSHLSAHAGQRRLAAQSDPAGAGQGLRVLPWQAVDGVLSRGGDAGRAGAGVARRQGASAAHRLRQRQAAGQAQRRRRHDLLVSATDRPCRPHAAVRGGQHHRLRTVSNKEGEGPGKPVDQGGAGYTCLAEVRTVETILEGKARTPFLRFGDRVRLEMLDELGPPSSAPSIRRWCGMPGDAPWVSDPMHATSPR